MRKCRLYLMKVLSVFLLVTVLFSSLCFSSFSVYAVSKPGKVSNLKITKTCSTAVSLNWSKSKGAKKYLVYRKLNGGKYRRIIKTPRNSYVSYNLRSNKKYTFKITPYKSVKGKIYFGPSKVKSINLKTAKTHTPKITSSNVKSKTKGIIKCLARCLWLKAYVQYEQTGIEENNWYYWLVTDVDSISAHKKRCLKYLSKSCYDKYTDDDLLIEKNNHLYVYSYPIDSGVKYDLNSITLKKKSGGYYYINCDAYSGLQIDGETKYVDQLKIKYDNGFFKCYSLKNIWHKYVGVVNKKRNLVW